ncbi:MAG: hypothetical protein WC861_01865 [Candidatus Micrarchaeia archaeon]|jgi:hypothetical protein
MICNGLKIEQKPETGIQKVSAFKQQGSGRQGGFRFKNYLHFKFFADHERTSLKGEEVLIELRNLRNLLANLGSKKEYGECMDASRAANESLHNVRFNSTWLADEQVKILIGWVVLRARHEMLIDRNIEAISCAPTLDMGWGGYVSVSRREWNRERPSEMDDCYNALASGFNNANIWFHALGRDPRSIGLIVKEMEPALEKLSSLKMPDYFRKEPIISDFLSNAIALLEKAKDEHTGNDARVAAMDALCNGALAASEIAQNYRIWEDIARKDFTHVLPKQKLSLSELIGAFKEAERLLGANEFEKADAAFRKIYESSEPHIKKEIREFIRLSHYFNSTDPAAIPEA